MITGLLLNFSFLEILYPSFDLPPVGPVSLKTIILFGLVHLIIKLRKKTWSDYGLKWSSSKWILLFIVAGCLLCKLLLLQPFSDWMRTALEFNLPDYSFFTHLEGNTLALVLWLCVAWIAGGFAEEMIFRGYLMQEISNGIDKGNTGLIIGLFIQAFILGISHFYAGIGGMIFAFISALFYGSIVLAFNKSLWPAILVHGLWDTFGILVFYLNGIPF